MFAIPYKRAESSRLTLEHLRSDNSHCLCDHLRCPSGCSYLQNCEICSESIQILHLDMKHFIKLLMRAVQLGFDKKTGSCRFDKKLNYTKVLKT